MPIRLVDTSTSIPQKWQRRIIALLLFLTFVTFALLTIFQQNPATLFMAAGASVLMGCLVISVTLIRSYRRRSDKQYKKLPWLFSVRDFMLLGVLYTALCCAAASFAILLAYGPALLLGTLGPVFSKIVSTDLRSSAIVVSIIAIGMLMAYVNHYMEWRIPRRLAGFNTKVSALFAESVRNYPRITDIVFCGLGVLLLAGVITLSAMNAVFAATAYSMMFTGVALLCVVKLLGDIKFSVTFRKSPYLLKRARFVWLGLGIAIASVVAILGLLASGGGMSSAVVQTLTLVVGSVFACVLLYVGTVQVYAAITAWQAIKAKISIAHQTNACNATDNTHIDSLDMNSILKILTDGPRTPDNKHNAPVNDFDTVHDKGSTQQAQNEHYMGNDNTDRNDIEMAQVTVKIP